jgi:hypothetical protein
MASASPAPKPAGRLKLVRWRYAALSASSRNEAGARTAIAIAAPHAWPASRAATARQECTRPARGGPNRAMDRAKNAK